MRILKWTIAGVVLAMVGALTGCALLDPVPVANFSWSPFEPLARADVQFTDMSTDTGFLSGGGITSWSWDFGDAGSSSAQHPKHKYEKGGNYTVRLTVTDQSGNTNSTQKPITVTPSLDGSWTGYITNLAYVQLSLRLDLNHSATGGITGTITIVVTTQPINSASFNASSREVQITSTVFGIILRGTLDANEDRISGYWYDDVTGRRGEDWSISLR